MAHVLRIALALREFSQMGTILAAELLRVLISRFKWRKQKASISWFRRIFYSSL